MVQDVWSLEFEKIMIKARYVLTTLPPAMTDSLDEEVSEVT
jgi:hypothetical protein